jgi:hypothetical protein
MDEAITSAQLGKTGPLLGAGGQARVYQAPALTLPNASGPLVFKEYKAGHQPPHGLRKLVSVRNGLDDANRHRLDQLAAWPLRVVEDSGRVRGVVLPLIPDSYFQERVLPGTGTRDQAPREIQNLLIPVTRARLVGMPTPTVEQRLGICRDFAAALHFVHRQNLVVGDVNAKNALYRLTGRPSVMLVDCDGIRIKGNMAVVAQLNAPDWDPPERVLTQQTDRYKLGLFVLRCLSTGEQASTTREPSRADAALDPDGRRLMRAALSDIPGKRPSAQDWGNYFQARLTRQRTVAAVAPPTWPASPNSRPPQTVATAGWVRDPATGQWTER